MVGTQGAAGPRRGRQHEQDGADPQVPRIAQILAAVLRCLRRQFPHDYFRRCAFAARGIRALLLQDGVSSRAVGGRFTALVVAKFDSHYALQGFADGPELYPHLWVETETRLIDLGPYLLPAGSPFPIVPMPPLIWNRAEPLPAALRYETIDVVPDDAPFSVNPAVAHEGDSFVALCMESCQGRIPFPHWIATGEAALDGQAQDPWVKAVRHFEHVVRKFPDAAH